MITLDDISMAVIALLRVGAAFRFVYCMVRLQSTEEAGQFKKRAKNTVVFYVIAECVWQIKDIIFAYYLNGGGQR